MKTIKSILAVSVLAATGAVNATTIASFDFSDNYTVSYYTNNTLGSVIGTGSMTAPATVDLSDTGVLTITGLTQKFFSSTGAQLYQATTNMTLTGSVDPTVGTFIVTAASTSTKDCVADVSGGCFMINGTKTVTIPVADNAVISLWAPATSTFTDSQCLPGRCDVAWNAQTFSFTAKTFVPGSCEYQPEGCSVPVIQQPLPSAAWLFGSGLIGVTGLVRRRRAV